MGTQGRMRETNGVVGSTRWFNFVRGDPGRGNAPLPDRLHRKSLLLRLYSFSAFRKYKIQSSDVAEDKRL